MRNRPAQLGLLLVEWANWGLDIKVHSLTRKQTISTNNTQKEWVDYWSKIQYNLAIIEDKIQYLNYVKSKPRFIPVVFPRLVSPGDNKILFIWVPGHFKSIGSVYLYFTNKVNMSQFSYTMEALKNTIDKINSFEFEIQVKSEITGENVISVKQINTKGKPWGVKPLSPEVQSVIDNHITYANNLQVRMHRIPVHINSNPTVGEGIGGSVQNNYYHTGGESSEAPGNVESSLNRGTNRTQVDIGSEDAEGDTDSEWEPSISKKGKERALEYTGSEDAEGESSIGYLYSPSSTSDVDNLSVIDFDTLKKKGIIYQEIVVKDTYIKLLDKLKEFDEVTQQGYLDLKEAIKTINTTYQDLGLNKKSSGEIKDFRKRIQNLTTIEFTITCVDIQDDKQSIITQLIYWFYNECTFFYKLEKVLNNLGPNSFSYIKSGYDSTPLKHELRTVFIEQARDIFTSLGNVSTQESRLYMLKSYYFNEDFKTLQEKMEKSPDCNDDIASFFGKYDISGISDLSTDPVEKKTQVSVLILNGLEVMQNSEKIND